MGNPLAITSDQTLLKAVRSGDRNAFETIVRKYQNLVTSIAYSSIGDLGRSEDIAQQAFLIAWQKQNEIADDSRLGGWLCGIVKNLVRNDRRKMGHIDRTQGANLDDVAEPKSDLATPDHIAIEKEQQVMLWSVLERLPENYREPLILYYREHQSVESVALQLGLSEDVVKQRLSRGRSMVRNEIQQFVEGALEQTRPTAGFASAVMAAIPAATTALASSAGKSTAGLVTSLTLKNLLGGSIMSGAALGIIGGGLGALIGMAGAWYGTQQAIKSATSEQERALTKGFSLKIWLATSLMAVMSIASILLDWSGNQWIPVVVITVVFSSYVVVMSFWYDRRLNAVKLEHGTEEEKSGVVRQPPLSRNSVRLNTIWAASSLWVWFVVLMAVSQAWLVIAISVACLVGLGVYIWKTTPAKADSLAQAKFMSGAIVISAIGLSVITVFAWPAFFFAADASASLRWIIPLAIMMLTAIICGAVVSAVERRYRVAP